MHFLKMKHWRDNFLYFFVTCMYDFAMWHNFKGQWVCCIMPFVLHHIQHIFFPRKVDNMQDKQLKPCCMYNAVGVMYHKINYFCFSRHSKICFRWKTLFRITSDTPLDKLALKHSEFSKVLNGCCFLHQKHDMSNCQ